MNQLGVILALIFSLIIALFALANQQPVTISYLYGEAQVSAIVVILGSAILGALIIFLLSLFRHIRMTFTVRGLRSELNTLKEQLQEKEEEREMLQDQIEQFQAQLHRHGENAGERKGSGEAGEKDNFSPVGKDMQEYSHFQENSLENKRDESEIVEQEEREYEGEKKQEKGYNKDRDRDR